MYQEYNPPRGRALARRLSGYLAVLASLLLTLVAPSAYAANACNVVYTISPQNSSQFGATLNIENTGTIAWTSWSLTWTFANGQTISNSWNGTVSQSGANVTVSEQSGQTWENIPAGGSYSGFGFNGTWNGVTNAVPTSFAVNGTTCGATGSFTLKPSASTLSIAQGASGTDTITVTDVSPFAGSVTLAATGLPSGVTVAYGTNPTTGSSVLTFTASATATVGTATVTITGTSGTLSATTSIALTITAKPTFTLSVPTLSITQGKTATDTITITGVGGFTGNVTLAVSSLPSGVTCTFGTNPATTTSVMTCTASASATVGSFTATITGTSGSTVVTTSFPVTVVSSTGGFTLGPAGAGCSMPQGGSCTVTISVTDISPFTGSVTLTASGLPSGVTVAFGTNPTATTSVLTFTASSTATLGTSTVTITGTSGSLSATTSITVTITAKPSFTLAPSASTLSITQGSTATDTITVTDLGGFTGSVTLATAGLPSGVTVAYGTNPTTTTSVLTFTASSTATLGTSTITITGTSGSTTATTIITLTVTAPGSGYAATAKANFLAMYGDMTAANGYFSPLGIPYHSVETFMVEAPDYGHETVSETYSYYLWLESMYGAVTGTWTPLQTAWDNMQTYMIPSATLQPTNSGYNPSAPATYCPTYDSPSDYPCQFSSTSTVPVGEDPIAQELESTYGTWNIYGMHWILDTTNWYGYGIEESGPGSSGAPSFYNSYQRGPMESVWLTIPQPSWDIFKYGNTSDGGYLSLFTGGSYTQQWKYTDAPDADARAIQALYWAQQYSNGNSTVASLLPLGAQLGDYLRYSFFDKYFKEQGCQSTSCPVENGSKNSSAYLLSWYYAWGGAVPADGSWAWRIGSSDVHFGYQNPLVAYALSNDTALIPKSPTAKADWTTTLERTLEFYRWLQSSNGAIAGGATNSWGGGSNTANPPTAWGGQYAVPPAGTPTFYGMSYIFAPSYGNPPSNQWFGMQAWSMERLAEYYYVTGNADAKIILDPWMKWVEANSTATATSYSIPSSLSWSGQPSTNWNATTQNWTVGDLGVTYNAGLTVTITASGQDVGVTGSLCKALLYYSAGTLKWAGTQDMTSFNLAKQLLIDVWSLHRDSIGVSVAETRTDYSNLTIPIYVPSGWTGTMPNGDPINSSSTFLSIRTQYESDPNYAMVAAYAANPSTAPVPSFNYHRFWAQTDVATAYAVYYLLFPND